MAWLNKSRAASLYLVNVETVRIAGADTAAPLLTLIVAPSEEARWAGERKDELAERHVRRRRFWTELLNRAKGRTQVFAAVSPGMVATVVVLVGQLVDDILWPADEHLLLIPFLGGINSIRIAVIANHDRSH